MAADHIRVPQLDVEFLRKWSPARVMTAGILIYVAAIVVSPLQYEWDLVTLGGTVYAIATIGAFYLGCYAGQVTNSYGPPIEAEPFRLPLDRYVNITLVIAIFSIATRAYDRFIVRGFTVEQTFYETRETIENTTVSFYGYLGGPGFCFGLIALALIWLSGSQRRRPVAFALACALAAYPIIEGLLQGSRSILLHAAFMTFLFARSTRTMKWLFASPIALLGGVVAMLVFFQLLFEMRSLEVNDFKDTAFEVYQLSAMSNYATPPEWVTNIIVQSNGGLFEAVLKAWVHFEQHFTHSWLVYYDNFERFDGERGWGRMFFFIPVRLVGSIAGVDLTYSPGTNGMQEGLFSTAITYLYYDFGALGVFASGLFGFGATLVQAWAIRLPERWLPLHVMFMLFSAMMLIDAQVVGGLASYAIYGCVFYALLHFTFSKLFRESSIGMTEGAPLGPPRAVG